MALGISGHVAIGILGGIIFWVFLVGHECGSSTRQAGNHVPIAYNTGGKCSIFLGNSVFFAYLVILRNFAFRPPGNSHTSIALHCFMPLG